MLLLLAEDCFCACVLLITKYHKGFNDTISGESDGECQLEGYM